MASTSSSLQPLLLSITLFSLISSVVAQTCSTYKFSNKKVFTSCSDLPVLNSFLHWDYNSKTGIVNLAYRQPGLISNSRWISWGINPTAKGMKGVQSLVAFTGTDGNMRAYTSPITAYRTTLEPGDLSFPVSDVSAVSENNEMIIFASIQLLSNSSKVNHLWQEGPLKGDIPGIHALSGSNMKSMATLDFLSGKTATVGGGNSKQKNKNVHGVLSAVSWGILMPLGIIIARYLKVSKSAGPAWFYLHASCQVSAYIVGVAGWITGLKLGSSSSGLQYNAHRNIGIALFCLGTLQVFALLLRPKPNHKYRLYWNMYHQGTGYIVIILSIINIFKGFDILDPEKKWMLAYTIVLASLGGITAALEALTWILVIRQKKAGMNNTSVCQLSRPSAQ